MYYNCMKCESAVMLPSLMKVGGESYQRVFDLSTLATVKSVNRLKDRFVSYYNIFTGNYQKGFPTLQNQTKFMDMCSETP